MLPKMLVNPQKVQKCDTKITLLNLLMPESDFVLGKEYTGDRKNKTQNPIKLWPYTYANEESQNWFSPGPGLKNLVIDFSPDNTASARISAVLHRA